MEVLEGRLAVADLDAFVARLGELSERHEVTIQAFDATYLAGRRHLERSVELADRALERGENVARDRAVEILLYAAGRRQIDRALEMGVSEGENRVVVLFDAGPDGEPSAEARASEAFADAEQFEPEPTLATAAEGGRETPDEALETPDEDTLQTYFDITDAERAATDASLEDLVCERVALLEVEK